MTPAERPGVVFDCMVFFQATARRAGPAAACFTLLQAGAFSLFVSEEILAEVREVLSRPAIRRKNPRLTDEEVNNLFGRLAKDAVLVRDVPKHFTYPRDPDDEPYLNLAIEVRARYLVSRDKDLLDLRNDPDFAKRFPDLAILDPADFLKAMSAAGEAETGPEKSEGPQTA